jgi:protein-tyrosine phosphatase
MWTTITRSNGARGVYLVEVIDLHCHVLPGIDDGPRDMDGSIALARAAVAAGTRLMAATPHVALQYPVVPGELAERVAELREALRRANVPLEVAIGGELAPSGAGHISDDELRAIALGGSSCVLLECPFTNAAPVMPALVTRLQRRGFRVLLAHPERSPEFLRDRRELSNLVEGGAYVQVTAASLRGDFGRTVRRYSLDLLDAGLVHVVASDAHDASGRGPGVLAIVQEVVRRQGLSPAMTELLTETAPRALLDDVAPPRPLTGTHRRRRRTLIRR